MYNTFPWPENISKVIHNKIVNNARKVLKIREKYNNSTLADLYDINTMPIDLVKAHQDLDKAVESAYGIKTSSSDLEKMRLLFSLYSKQIND